MYRYETHLHTSPVSKCAKADVAQSLAFYKEMGYDGVFITNHFIDDNTTVDKTLPYEDRIHGHFRDYENGMELGKNLGLRVFSGVEMSYRGTDFLVYGLDKAWYLAHPEIMEMKMTEKLPFLMEEGALVIQAHPYREARYIDHLRLYPRHVHGVETVNACRKPEENDAAVFYAKHYGLLSFAGSDNHEAEQQYFLAGMEAKTPLENEQDFVHRILAGEMQIFTVTRPQDEV